ncbi:Hypothetical protein D9617_9g025420 [Elsinoe fawcettii]|nr:Hypothetical protein D9617_9g025420 [Elsinoe fawcettii]
MSKRPAEALDGPNKRPRISIDLSETSELRGMLEQSAALQKAMQKKIELLEQKEKDQEEAASLQEAAERLALANQEELLQVNERMRTQWKTQASTTALAFRTKGTLNARPKKETVSWSIGIYRTNHRRLFPSEEVEKRWISRCEEPSGIFHSTFSALKDHAADCFGITDVYKPFDFQSFWDLLVAEPPWIDAKLLDTKLTALDHKRWGHDTSVRQYAFVAILANRLLKVTPQTFLYRPKEERPKYAGWYIQDWALAIIAFKAQGYVVKKRGWQPLKERIKKLSRLEGERKAKIESEKQARISLWENTFSGEDVQYLADEEGEWWGLGGS